jgi:hypothetical protein
MNVNAVQHVCIVLILIAVCIFVRFMLTFTNLVTDLFVLYIGAFLNYFTSVLSGLLNFMNSTA